MENPDRLEKSIRFGCGFSFGLFIGFFSVALHYSETTGMLITAAVVSAILCGWLAMKYGDRFWHAFVRWWWF